MRGDNNLECKENFVIKVSQNFGGGIEMWYYYSGTTYIVHGEVLGYKKCQRLLFKKRAENAMEKLK